MSASRVWHAVIIALLVSFCCALLVLARPSLVSYLDNKSFDVLVSGLALRAPTGQAVVVDIDELSLAKLGHWPWPRDTVAHLARRIQNAGPSVVALDIVFPEPDAVASRDQALSEALSAGRSVIGFDFVFDSAMGRETECQSPPKPIVPFDVFPASQARLQLPEASAVICDVPRLASGVVKSGFLNAIHDSDGALRRIPLLMAYHGALYPSFALASVTSSAAKDSLVLIHQSQSQPLLRWRGKNIALSDGGTLLLRYRGPGQTLPHFSAAYVLDGLIPASAFAGKVVVIGSSAQGLQEGVQTPLDPAFPAVEVQATAIDNLLANDWFYRPRWALTLETASIFLATALTTFLLFRFSAFIGLGLTLVFAAAVWFSCHFALETQGAFLSPFPATAASFFTLSICSARIVLREGSVGRKSREEVATANRFITGALGAMTALRDVETGQHVVRIQAYLRSLCQQVAARPRFAAFLTPQMIDLLVQLAPIHDIGKVGVPDYILRKPGALTSDEFELMKSHVTLGKRILEEAREQSGLLDRVFFQTATDIVYSHHERWNGSGYPLGLEGDNIPIPGRLLAVADVYDALISKRHYKTEILHAEAVERIRAEAGNHFDPEIVEGFLAVEDDWRKMAAAHSDDPGLAASAR